MGTESIWRATSLLHSSENNTFSQLERSYLLLMILIYGKTLTTFYNRPAGDLCGPCAHGHHVGGSWSRETIYFGDGIFIFIIVMVLVLFCFAPTSSTSLPTQNFVNRQDSWRMSWTWSWSPSVSSAPATVAAASRANGQETAGVHIVYNIVKHLTAWASEIRYWISGSIVGKKKSVNLISAFKYLNVHCIVCLILNCSSYSWFQGNSYV